ncbi:MAG: PLP-dependent aminotransferase family protein [Pseudomonadota bacterium]
MPIPPDSFYLDRDGEGTLQNRIKRLVVDGILSGRFHPRERLPSSRALARHLGVSRITVTLAYTDLVADDYLTGRGRAGYFVSDTAPCGPVIDQTPAPEAAGVDWGRVIGSRGRSASRIMRPADWRSYRYPFVYGQTDPKLFDHQNWRLCALQAVSQREFDTLTLDQYERDDPKLVEFILRQILPRRGIFARPENILVTLGAQNALWLTAHLLLGPRRKAAMENPGYPGLRDVLQQTRCAVQAVDIDREGLPPAALAPGTDVVFVTASHHCPTNVTMPTTRRKEILHRADQQGFVVVEDDYEFELTFGRAPSPALKSLDERGCVIYIGSFSKSLFPGLRLGYLVAPEPFIEAARALRSTVLRHPPGLMQRTAANFLSLGHYDAQINRLRKTYQRRRHVMAQALHQYGLTIAGSAEEGGSSYWMATPDAVDAEDLARALHPEGVIIEPGGPFFAPDTPDRRHYRLSYSSISSARIGPGIELIAEKVAELAP